MPQLEVMIEVGVPSKEEILQKATDAISEPLIAKIRSAIQGGLRWNEEDGRLTGDVTVELEQSDLDQIESDPLTEETFMGNTRDEAGSEFNDTVDRIIGKLKSAVESADF